MMCARGACLPVRLPIYLSACALHKQTDNWAMSTSAWSSRHFRRRFPCERRAGNLLWQSLASRIISTSQQHCLCPFADTSSRASYANGATRQPPCWSTRPGRSSPQSRPSSTTPGTYFRSATIPMAKTSMATTTTRHLAACHIVAQQAIHSLPPIRQPQSDPRE